MSIAQYLSKFALGVSSQGVLSAAKGGTGTTTGGGGGGSSPTVTAVSYPGDDTAADPAGGQTITLSGTNFAVGVKVLVNSTPVSVVTRVSSTQVTFIAPALSTGSYLIYVVNPDSSAAIVVPGLQVSPLPVWTTAAGSLGSVVQLVSFNTTLAATGDGTISYSISSGSLPTGLILNSSTGTISGNAPTVSSSTTYSFTVRSTDVQNQDTDRNFSITVTPSNAPPTVEYLVVGGGGGSVDTYYTGGGGAGGFITAANYAVNAATPYTVTVGAGGVVGSTTAKGGNSSFATITATGGGQGANATSEPASVVNGGSGGGHGAAWGSYYYNASQFPGGTGIAGQGNAGGTRTSDKPPYGWVSGGGGGGAGAAGATGNYSYTGNSYPYPDVTGGAGGAGLQSSITGTATWYAGGGGGSGVGSNTNTGGPGGQGGGGQGVNGGFGTYGSDGTANTGGGGGAGKQGGSGIVVIRYANTYDTAASTTGSPTYTNTGGYHIYKFISSGSITL